MSRLEILNHPYHSLNPRPPKEWVLTLKQFRHTRLFHGTKCHVSIIVYKHYMGVNMNSIGRHVHNMNLNLGWLPCAQCEFELGQLVAMCIEHRLSKYIFTIWEISQWQTNVFYVVQLTNFQGGKKCNIIHSRCTLKNF